MMKFQTKVAGIPCVCHVTHYSPGHPGKLTGPMEDAEEPMDEEFEYRLLNMNGLRLKDLEGRITVEEDQQLLEEFHVTLLEHKHYIDED